MIYLKRLLFTIIGVVYFVTFVFGQNVDRKLISGDFTDITLTQLVLKIESQTGCRFYFESAQLDSIKVNFNVKDQPLKEVLNQLFKGSGLQYAIDEENNIYITKEAKIRTQLPYGFFERKEIHEEGDNNQPGYLAEKAKEKSKAAAESKLYEIGTKTETIQPGNAVLSGHIRDSESGEPIIGAIIYIEGEPGGTATDQFGHYTITLPKGRHELRFKSVGMKSTKRQIILYSDGKLNVGLQEDIVALREVIITSDKDVNVKGTQMGVEKMDIKTMKQVPSIFGEADVLRVVLALPGVQSVGEGSTGLNVRGGSTDQNLILLNDATVYNPSHLFGFFSAFNPDVVKNVELYKSAVPSEYGGRLSSVLKVTTRDGNKKKFGGTAGISPLTARLTFEGPIWKDKTSFLLGTRFTYSDWVLKQLSSPAIQNSSGSFYDINAQVSHDINENNILTASAYYSKDQFKLNGDTSFSYTNSNAVLKWSHIFRNNFYGVFTGGYSNYDYAISSVKNPVNAYKMTYGIAQYNVKADFNYTLNSKHTIDFGASSIFYKLTLGSYQPLGDQSLVTPQNLEGEQGLESALYIADKYDITPRFSLYYGLRYSIFNYLGPRTIANYAPDLPIDGSNELNSISYGNNAVIKTYSGPEYRLSARYSLTESSSLKLSYNRMRQYMNMLSNTTAISPTDIWKLSDPYIKPQVSDQVSLGFYNNFKSNTIETSVEVYYKNMSNMIGYKNGATIVLNPHLETDVVNAVGKAYGVEVMLKKNAGKVNGWVSYTFSRSFSQINDPANSIVVNGGQYFPTNYDKPHSVNFIGNYKFSRRFSVSMNVVYSTGRPITLPQAKYTVDGSERFYYSDRNQYRVPDYFRVDLSLNIEGNHKVKKLGHSSWTVAVYNLTGRKNVYSIYFQSEGGVMKGYELSIFGQPIPTVTYNLKF